MIIKFSKETITQNVISSAGLFLRFNVSSNHSFFPNCMRCIFPIFTFNHFVFALSHRFCDYNETVNIDYMTIMETIKFIIYYLLLIKYVTLVIRIPGFKNLKLIKLGIEKAHCSQFICIIAIYSLRISFIHYFVHL